MKTNMIIQAADWVLIAIMSLCGTLAFIQSSTYGWIEKQTNIHQPAMVHFLPFLIGAVIFIFGCLTIILWKKGGGGLTWLVVIVSLPSFLSFDSLDLIKILGEESRMTTRLGFYQVMGLGIVIMTCYILLSSIHMIKQSRFSLIRHQAYIEDIEYIDIRSFFFMIAAATASFAAAIVMAASSRGIEAVSSNHISGIPWYAILISLGCILILTIYLYWMGTRNSKT